MKYREGVFIVTYAIKKKEIFYLLLERILHWRGWEFPKGGIEKKDKNIEKTIAREIKEETGLKIKKIIKFDKKGKFNYGRELPDRPGIKGQSWQLFAVEVKKSRVRIDKREHISYKWLKFKDAYSILTWANQKFCLKLVNKYLKRKLRC